MNQAKAINARAAAASILFQVIDQGQSMSQMLSRELPKVSPRDHGLVQELCYGVLRWLPRFEYLLNQQMDKPLKGKTRVVHFLLMAGLYQLFYMRVPAHAAVSETVDAAEQLRHRHLKKLVNGVLRQAERQGEGYLQQLPQTPTFEYCHPGWISKKLQAAYPEHWQAVLEANNQHAPMWLRVNAQRYTPQAYLEQLHALEIDASLDPNVPSGIRLEKALPVSRLPEFEQGSASVQDGAAQMAALLLDPQPGDRVLDACAAPGGKTCHLLEVQPEISELIAIDADPQRLKRVEENLQRIGLKAEVKCADATDISSWNDQPFDRILLDAPCSATGVIRRHPDIKWLRRESDIAELVKLQALILKEMWRQLKPGGTLLYATCSILPEENSLQIAKFIQENSDACLQEIAQNTQHSDIGWQLLPGEQQRDGFYYALITKTSSIAD